jgi:hypothetical protein
MRNTTATTADERILLERLRADCDVAFRNWAAQVRVLQSVRSGDSLENGAIEQARRWAEEAAAVYREKRNLLLELMMRSQPMAGDAHPSSGKADSANGSRPMPDGPKERARQVERIARQIWEESGRPADSAEQDWLQAEEILDTRR